MNSLSQVNAPHFCEFLGLQTLTNKQSFCKVLRDEIKFRFNSSRAAES